MSASERTNGTDIVPARRLPTRRVKAAWTCNGAVGLLHHDDMQRQNVVSREYKVMLRPDRFSGDGSRALKIATEFWREFAARSGRHALGTAGAFQPAKRRRFIRFYDTDRQALHDASYVLRRRWSAESEIDAGEGAELTLKFRHPDRYIAEHRCFDPTPDGAELKFEEDIKGPFVSFYSCSTTVKTKPVPGEMPDVADLFPAVKERITTGGAPQRIGPVRAGTIVETVLDGASIQLGAHTEAECALILWHDSSRDPLTTIAAEFSYRYGDKHEDYQGDRTERAFEVFKSLQTDLPGWVDPALPTKTALVYGAAVDA